MDDKYLQWSIMKPDIKLAGVCGLYCGKCDIYLAYAKNDTERKKKIAQDISQMVKKEIKPEQIVCDGCHGEDNLCWSNDCKLRVCCLGKGYDFCFECQDYPCIELNKFAEQCDGYKKAIANLEEMKKIGVGEWLGKQGG